MARKVFVSSDIGQDEALLDAWELDPQAPLLWPWILPILDDWGRGSADPRRIKAAMFGLAPVTVEDIERALQVFAHVGLLKLYEVDGRRYMAVDQGTWFKYQTHIHQGKREDDSRSQFPPPPADYTPPPPPSAESRGNPRGDAENRASLHHTSLHLSTPHHTSSTREAPLARREQAPASRERPRNEVWDGLAVVFGDPTTRTNRTLRGKVARSLQEAGATEEEIIQRAARWPLHFEDATLTETALEKHWDRLGRPPLRPSPAAVEKARLELERLQRRRRAELLDAEELGLPPPPDDPDPPPLPDKPGGDGEGEWGDEEEGEPW